MPIPARGDWMRAFLASEAEAQTVMLSGLRGRLERGMAAADPKSTEPPSREWVRAARIYFDGYRALATLELEHAKLRLLAQRPGATRPMTDEEYQAQLTGLRLDAVRTMTDAEFQAEVERRRTLPEPAADP